MVMAVSIQDPLTEIQKKQYLTELGLEPILGYYNNEIRKHDHICFKKRELFEKRDRCFKLMREECRELV
jgi:hypothetical protein